VIVKQKKFKRPSNYYCHERGAAWQKGVMGYQDTRLVLTGTLSRGQGDTGEKMEGAARMAEVGRRFRKLAPRDAKKVDKDDRTQESDKRRGTSGTTPTQRRRDDAGS